MEILGGIGLKTMTFYASMALYGISAVYILALVLPMLHKKQAAGAGGLGLTGSGMEEWLELSERADAYEVASGHAYRVAELACNLADRYGLSARDIENLRMAALLHDIGQIDNCPYIKESRLLTQEERLDLEKHSLLGYRLITQMGSEHEGTAKWVRWHHEHWDGTGYPDRLMGEEIPLPARILSVVDAYDAMSNDRPHRPALAPERILQELQRYAGLKFDPQVVQLLCATLVEGSVEEDLAGASSLEID